MANWCLPQAKVNAFKDALRSGRIDPDSLSEMSSADRRAVFEKELGVDHAKQINTEFEGKLLLKNRQQGYVSWAKKVLGENTPAGRDLISRVQRMDKLLSPTEEKTFLSDLAAHRLGMRVTAEEASKIAGLSKAVGDARTAMEQGGDRGSYGQASLALRNYVGGLKADAEWKNKSPAAKVLQTASNAFFNIATFGHGTVGPVTHAGENIFHPSRWGNYFKNVGRTWGSAFSPKFHQEQMGNLVADPNFDMWRKEGLANEPGAMYDEYQNPQLNKMFGFVGKMGNRGFDALKTMREDFANARWNKLNESQRTPEMAKVISDLVNHSTGAVRTKVLSRPITRSVFFAAPLEASRWARILGDPVKAADTYSQMAMRKSVSPEDKYFAKSVVKNHAEFLATYLGALALNSAVLKATGSDDKVNYTDPSKPDWLRFKVKGRAIDPTGGLISTIGFLGRLGAAAVAKPKEGETRYAAMGKAAAEQARSKLSPAAGLATDVVTRSDFSGRPLPFSSETGTAAKPRYTYPEYVGGRVVPIPMSAGIRDFYDQMEKQGVPMSTARQIIDAALSHPKAVGTAAGIGLAAGTTGIHVGAEYQPSQWDKKSPPEKLARQQRRRYMNEEDLRTEDEINRDKQLAEIRRAARTESRSANDDRPQARAALQALVNSGQLSLKKGNAILNTPSNEFLDDVQSGSLTDALNVYDIASPRQRQDLIPLIIQKRHLLNEMSGNDQAAAENRLKKLGIPLSGQVPPREIPKKMFLQNIPSRVQPVVNSAP